MSERSAAGRLGIGLVGVGAAARQHAKVISADPHTKLVGVLSRRPAAAQQMAQEFGCHAMTDYDELLTHPEVEAIILANEPQRHGLAIRAAERGRHVLVEKPLAAGLEEATAIADACRRHRVVGSVVSQRRFDTSLGLIQDVCDTGAIGKVLFADACIFIHRDKHYFEGGNGWRKSDCGGLILNRLIHHLDQFLVLFGQVRSVYAEVLNVAPDITVDHHAVVTLAFSAGTLATIRSSSAFRDNYGESLHLAGESGSIRIAGGRVVVSQSPLGDAPRDSRVALLRRALHPGSPPISHRDGTLADQLKDFREAIAGRRGPRVTVEDGVRALRVALAALESYRRGARVLVAEN